jgi:osmotically-inducible protein OsmY
MVTNEPLTTGETDTDIALTVARALEWSPSIPQGRILVEAHGRWVTLEGTVDREYQRSAVECSVRRVRGVAGVTNCLTVQPQKMQAAQQPA